MSALLFNKLRNLQEQIDALGTFTQELRTRIIELEVSRTELELAAGYTPEPKRGPGRPRKVAEQ